MLLFGKSKSKKLSSQTSDPTIASSTVRASKYKDDTSSNATTNHTTTKHRLFGHLGGKKWSMPSSNSSKNSTAQQQISDSSITPPSLPNFSSKISSTHRISCKDEATNSADISSNISNNVHHSRNVALSSTKNTSFVEDANCTFSSSSLETEQIAISENKATNNTSMTRQPAMPSCISPPLKPVRLMLQEDTEFKPTECIQKAYFPDNSCSSEINQFKIPLKTYETKESDSTPTFECQTPLKTFCFPDFALPLAFNDEVGSTRKLLKRHLLARLVSRRDPKLSDFVTNFQRYCRRVLAKKTLAKHRIRHLSVQCIGRNLDHYMEFRSWSWNKLYIKILPLINVNKTDEELKIKTDEIERFRLKVQKLENTCSDLKSNCQILENRLLHSESALSDEQQTAAIATESLQMENKLRLQLETNLADCRTEIGELETAKQLLDDRLAQYEMTIDSHLADELAQSCDEDEEDQKTERGSGGPIGLKFFGNEGGDVVVTEDYLTAGNGASLKDEASSSTSRVVETVRAKILRSKNKATVQLAKQKEEYEQILIQQKENMDELNKNNEKLSEYLEIEKDKSKKLAGEVQDLQSRYQETTVLNSELETSQQKLKDDMGKFEIAVQLEKEARNAIKHQVDGFEREKSKLIDDLNDLQMKYKDLQLKYDRTQNNTTEVPSVANENDLKVKYRELERKYANLQMECEDNVEELEIVKQKATKLEMLNNKMKLDDVKERQRFEEEMDEMRGQLKTKILNLEQQLEEEQVLKLRHLRQLRDLESKLMQNGQKSDLETPKNREKYIALKKSLKGTKLLLKDAQSLLDHYQETAPNRCAFAKVKNQLEESESSRVLCAKQKENLEVELTELKDELETTCQSKTVLEERCARLGKEKSNLDTLLTDQEYELQSLLKKFNNLVQQYASDSKITSQQLAKIVDLEKERGSLSDKVFNLSNNVDRLEIESSSSQNRKNLALECKIRELESKLESEKAHRIRLEATSGRLRAEIESLQDQLNSCKSARERESDFFKKFQNRLVNCQDLLLTSQKEYISAEQKIIDLTNQIERLEQENILLKSDYDFTSKRLQNLHANFMQHLYSSPTNHNEGDVIDEEDHVSSSEDEDCGGNDVVIGTARCVVVKTDDVIKDNDVIKKDDANVFKGCDVSSKVVKIPANFNQQKANGYSSIPSSLLSGSSSSKSKTGSTSSSTSGTKINVNNK